LSNESREITREFAIKLIEKKIKKFRKIKFISPVNICTPVNCIKIEPIIIKALMKKANFKLNMLKNVDSHFPLYKPSCFALKLAKRPSMKN